MCVIIVRNPGIEIDPEKISSACEVNPHGFGVSIVDRGKLETIKYFNEKGNDAKELLTILDQEKDNLVFAHLRFSTKGAKNQDNCHPFRIFQDGIMRLTSCTTELSQASATIQSPIAVNLQKKFSHL